METPNVSIESPHNTDESKIVLERMECDSRRPQHIDTDNDRWNEKMTRTDHQPTTMKRKSPVDSSMAEELEEEEEGHFSSSEQLLFKSLSDAISEYQEPSEQRRHQGRNNSHHDGAREMVSQLNRRKPKSEEPISPNKRPRYQRRNSFVIRRDDKNHPFFPPALPNLVEGYDDDDGESPLNRSTPEFLFSPKPDEMPSDTEDWGKLSYTEWSYKFSAMSFESAAS